MPPGAVPHSLDDSQFTALLQQSMPAVRAFLRRLLPEVADAEDVLQETMAKVWRLRGSFDAGHGDAGPSAGHAPGDGWLLQAAFRTFCDHRRRRRRLPATAVDSGEHPAPARPCPTELQDEVQHHLLALLPLERALLLGFHAEGLSLRELAARHRLPLNTVKSHLHRARRRLQENPDART